MHLTAFLMTLYGWSTTLESTAVDLDFSLAYLQQFVHLFGWERKYFSYAACKYLDGNAESDA